MSKIFIIKHSVKFPQISPLFTQATGRKHARARAMDILKLFYTTPKCTCNLWSFLYSTKIFKDIIRIDLCLLSDLNFKQMGQV